MERHPSVSPEACPPEGEQRMSILDNALRYLEQASPADFEPQQTPNQAAETVGSAAIDIAKPYENQNTAAAEITVESARQMVAEAQQRSNVGGYNA